MRGKGRYIYRGDLLRKGGREREEGRKESRKRRRRGSECRVGKVIYEDVRLLLLVTTVEPQPLCQCQLDPATGFKVRIDGWGKGGKGTGEVRVAGDKYEGDIW